LYYGKTPERETEDNPLGVIKLYHIYRKIDQRGIQIDDTKRQNLRIKYQILLDIHEAQLRYMTQLKLNVNSPKQIGELIYEELKFPVRKKTSPLGVSGYNTEEEVLEALALLPPGANKRELDGIEIVELILFCRKLYRTLQTLDTPTHLDNRMRFNYNLSGTENGRTSASKTFDEYFYVTSQGKVEKKKLGHSPQTFGKHGFRYKDQMYGQDLREIFVPSPGRILVEGDLSQAEARVDAVLASDFDILPRFDDETGIHRLTASWVYSCSPAEIIKGSEQYHIGKTIRHAAERDMQPALLSMLIHKPLQFCTDLLQTFNSTQPKIKAIFHTDIRNFVRKNRFLVAPNGRRRDFFGRMDDSLINEAISFLPQAIVSDQMKFTMVPFYEDDNEFPFLYEGHDAIMAEILPDQLQAYAERFKRIAERKINFNTCSLSRDYELTIPVEITTSENNWADMKVLK
jgi:DNA polymerase-1